MANNEEEKDINQQEELEVKEELTEEFPITEATTDETTTTGDGKPEDVAEGTDEKPVDGGDVPGDAGASDTENKETDEGEKKEEEEVEEGETSLDTEKSENSSVENDSEEKGEAEEKTEDIPPTKTTEELMAEIEDLKFEQETNQQIQNFNDIVVKQQNEYAEFQKALNDKIVEELDRYDIPLDADVKDLQMTDPAKFQILNNIITNARAIHDEVLGQIKQPVMEASENIVFRVAGAKMRKYNLNPEESKEAAATFVQIMNEVGIKDLKDDIDSKVELSVARAKMLLGQKAPVVDTPTVEETKEEVTPKVTETPKVVEKKEGKKLEDFTKGIVTNKSPGADVTESNVMDLYLSKKGTDRLAFFQKHQNLIMEQLKKTQLPYTDDSRRW